MIPFAPAEFQKRPIDEIVRVALDTWDKIQNAPSDRRRIAAAQGTVLLQSTTGSGKTVMIAAALERVSRQVKTVWFWFTPFGGTVVQTRDAIAKCASGLDPRDPQTDRVTETVTSGRVFVTTWQSVAVSNAESRKLRQDDDTEVSVDTLIAALRADGWLIGAVIDEAHHSFRGQNQAVRFYLEVLQPDVTIMATATPRDEDVKAFCQSVGVRLDQINKIGVARKDVVAARLNKVGIRAVSFRPVTRDARLIDTRETAVEAALAHHNRVKALLAERNIDLTPLLLIQVESGETSIAGMKRFLLDRGVPEDVIAQHSADQPDPYLHTIAYDEQKEILIFKMAVATGFDAPRAFTLASARSSRDRDFGMQLVGRIMRVHPKLRAYKTLPVELDYGFVFLAHPEAQAGLGTAAAELATLKTEISSVTDKVRTISIAVGKAAVTNPATGFLDVLNRHPHDSGINHGLEAAEDGQGRSVPLGIGGFKSVLYGDLFGDNENGDQPAPAASSKEGPPPAGHHSYRLRTDISGIPRRFETEKVPLDFTPLAEKVAEYINIDDGMRTLVFRQFGQVMRTDRDVFETDPGVMTEERARISDRRAFEEAQRSFDFSDRIDVRRIRQALVIRLKREILRAGIPMPEDGAIRRGLNLILLQHPKLIAAACRAVMTEVVEVVAAEEIPEAVYAPTPLETSRFNAYGVLPSDMGSWEIDFARYLDEDDTGTVAWWHRNPDRKPWSVAIVKGDGHRYFPDFIVGLNGPTPPPLRLVEVKERIGDERNEVANRSRHRSYGSALMVSKVQDRWSVVRFIEGVGRNQLDRDFDYKLLKSWV